MTLTIPLTFSFKGMRNYVHGTDIYNRMFDFFQQKHIKPSKLDLSFHGIASKNMSLSFDMPENKSMVKFICKYTDEKEQIKICYGIEREEHIYERIDCPEEEIISRAKIDKENQSIYLSEKTPFTFIEEIVSLNKKLLTTMCNEKQGKWYFTRLQLNMIPLLNFQSINLVLKANFNYKLTKTEVFQGNNSLGFIYFSMV